MPFSSALIEQVGFYAKRLRKEEATRRLGLIFMALAMAVQALVVFQPSESANAASQNDMVNGGISSLNEYLQSYDANIRNLKDVMNYAGITRSEILSTTYSSWRVNEKISWGFLSHFSYTDGERQHSITTIDSKAITVYSGPLKLWLGANSDATGWVGYSQKMGWFAITKDNGNLVTDTIPTSNNYPTSGIIFSKTAINNSHGFVDATSLTATASDRINYTISISNNGSSVAYETKLEDNLSDILEYSTLIDAGGGTLNPNTNVLSWPDVNLSPGDKQTRTFIAKLLDPIPSTAKGKSNGTSFDCIMTNTFGNSTNIKVDCPAPKILEQTVTQLPVTGPTENIIFISVLIALTTYFYARTRQMRKELNIIKKDAISGMIQGI